MMLRELMASFLAAILFVQPAAAEPREFKASGNWKHPDSGIILPEAIGAANRVRMVEYGSAANVSAAYQDAATTTTFTIYIYPSSSGSVPIWFNEARRALVANQQLGKVTAEAGIHGFTPPGRTEKSGLVESMSVDGIARSTGLAMFEAKGHLIKLRATSSKLMPTELEQSMSALLARIEWPKPLQGDVKLAPVEDCPAAMSIGAAHKKPANLVAVMLSSSVADTAGKHLNGSPPIYCREPANGMLNAYRPSAANDRYLLPLGDSGNALVVGRDEMMGILAKTDPKNGEAGYWVRLYTAGEIAGVEHYDALPTPDQATEALSQSAPYYRVVRRGEKTEINISAERVPTE